MIVVDASALVQVLLLAQNASRIEEAVFRSGRTLNAPHLLDVEIASAVRRLAASGEIEASRGLAMLELVRDLPIERHGHTGLLPRIWQLRENLSACDATYVALAEILDALLVTHDARLATAAGHLVTIELV